MPITEIFLSILLVTSIVGYDVAHTPKDVVAEVVNVQTPAPTITPAPIPTDIPGYISYKFSKYAPKAFLLLNGNENCGGENKKLDPNAYNTNDDGSRDWSIFQINDKFHPVAELHLATNWKANVDYAWRMFKNDGYTFSKRWVAGKCLARMGIDI